MLNWFGDDLQVKLKAASAAMIAKASEQTVAEAKVNVTNNGQVDTGFMRESMHVAELTETRGVVAVGAEYGIYQEMKKAFLYPAAERVANSYEGQIVAAGSEKMK